MSPRVPRRRTSNANPYATAAYDTPPAGSMQSSSSIFWHKYVETAVQSKAPGARITSTCASGTGSTRYLFTGIALGEIDSVKRVIFMKMFGMCEFGFVETESPLGAPGAIRDVTSTFYVDVLPDADATLRRRRSAFRVLCNWNVAFFLVCLACMIWAVRAVSDHYKDYDQPFATHIDTFKETIKRVAGE